MIVPMKENKRFSKLTHIHLAGLKLNDYCWDTLRKGIKKTRVLRTLIVNMTTIDRNHLKMLADAMRHNLSVDTIDLSYNEIKDCDGDLLAKIIWNQS